MRRSVVAVLLAVVAVATPVGQGERVREDVHARIRDEGDKRSQILRTLHYLTDLYGPRLTGSPNHRAAAEWSVKRLTEWGLSNGRLEPWDFGRPGWLNERFSGHIVAPVKDALVGEVLGWTPSTNGTVSAGAVQIEPPSRPTQAEFDAWAARISPAIQRRIVLVGPHRLVPVTLDPPARRRPDEAVRRQYDPDAPPGEGRGRGRGRSNEPEDPTRLSQSAVNRAVNALLLKAGVLVRVNDAARDHGQIRAFQNATYDMSQAPPTVVLRNEDYGRISRLLASDHAVRLEFSIVNTAYPEGRTSYNAIAEIPGTDRADEVVMLGGHLDSWHAATGATDNAIGCAIMMEAARILTAIGAKPRRTVRVALWSGEEQGLLGSRAYVRDHFGSFEDPKPEFWTFNGYFNVDSGTGRIRGASVFGPPAAATVLRQALAPFGDFGVVGAVATTSRRTGGTDSTSFNAAGLPGISLGQDPIEYGSYTWHTNLDTYERIIEDDAKKSAIAIAAAVYHLAMRDEMLPRFSKETMPPPAPAGRGGGRGE